MPFFSILIPSYKSEKYIEECVDSVFNQSFSDFEVIICDQAETDSSFLLKKYSNIQIIRRKEPSAYLARKTLLKQAAGKYLLFLDSDDKYKNNFFIYLYSIIISTGEKDLYHFNLELFQNEDNCNLNVLSNKENKIIEQTKSEFLDFFLLTSKNNSVSTKCYKNKGYNSYELYDVSYNKATDRLLNISLIKPVNSILYIDFAPYLYRFNSDSITHMPKIDYIEQCAFCCLKSLEICETKDQRSSILLMQLSLTLHICLQTIKNKSLRKHGFEDIYSFNNFKVVLSYVKNNRDILSKLSFKNKFTYNLIINKKYYLLKFLTHFYHIKSI